MGLSRVMSGISIVSFFLLILIQSVSAATLSSYMAEYHIVDDAVVVELELNYEEPFSSALQYTFPADVDFADIYIDGIRHDTTIEDGKATIPLENIKKFSMSYVTKSLLDKQNFLLNLNLPSEAEKLDITLYLPKGYTLKTKLGEKPGSIFPTPTEATTDGESLIFSWHRENLLQGDEFSAFVIIKKPVKISPIFAILVLLLLGAVIVYVLKAKDLLKKSTKIKEKIEEKPTEKVAIKEEPAIEKHLKEEEAQIVRILKDREGNCEQGTLRVVTGFSKASLSRLLKELEDRKIIHKEKRGKKNLVFLKE